MKLIMLFKRKPGMTVDQFREHYERSHAPLAVRLLPYFKSYTRNYVCHDMSYEHGGLGVEMGFDVVTELTFETRADYERMKKALTDPSIGDAILRDEQEFMDRSPGGRAMFFVDEETTPPSLLKTG